MWQQGGFLPKLSLTVFALLASFCGPALAENRVALVVGNDRYPNLSADRQLQKAANDAQAVGEALARLGFQVIRGTNLGRQNMIDKLSELTAQLAPGDTAAFFYAGHGVAIGGVNYLVPSDVPSVTPDAEARVRGASIAEADVVAELQNKGVRVALLVLDACRDNPFPRTATRAIGYTRGLADAKPARGIFTIYSAGIGQTALDRLDPNDSSRNSVFTRVFIKELAKPGGDLGGLAIEVRERVAELALKAKDEAGKPDPHEQTPAYYDQTIGGRVYLAGLSKPNEPSQHLSGQSGPSSVATPTDPAAQAWATTKDTTSQAVLEDFIRQFGSTPYGSMARARVEELKKAQVATVALPVKPAAPRRSPGEDQKSGVSLASYNGSWAFNMTSSCGFASPSRLSISDGIIHAPNGGGRISPNGSVSAHWSRAGLLNARLVGRMTSSSSGSGSWRNNLGCRGQWRISR